MARRLLGASLRLRVGAVPWTPALYRRGYSTVTSTVNTDAGVDQQETPQTTSGTTITTATGRPKPLEVVANFWHGGVDINQDRLILQVNTNQKRLYQHAMLRDSCKCSKCLDQHSKQRNFRTSDIPPKISPRSVNWDGHELVVQWQNDVPGFDESHVSKYTKEELLRPGTYIPNDDTEIIRPRYLWDKSIMDNVQHWITYDDYVNNDEKFTFAMRRLARFGLIFLKDVPDSREMVEKIATRMGPLRNTFYGPTWDVRKVPEAKNVAYTNQFLDFHMDLLYMESPPGFQFLHCLQNSCDGGESLFADTFNTARHMYKHQRTHFDILTKLRLRYEYLHEDDSYSRFWTVFDVLESKPSDSRAPFMAHVNYSPPFQGPGSRPIGPERMPPKSQLMALKALTAHLENPKNIFELKLNPGECVIFENRRVVHARRAFNTNEGERWLAGAYVDTDVVQSKFRTLKEKYPEAWQNGNIKQEVQQEVQPKAQPKPKAQ